MKLSATIITFNEQARLPGALAALAFCDEIVVVDSGSTDSTVEIARSSGARVIEHSWPGYAAQKNLAAQAAANDWILSLDADEEPSPELLASIHALLAREPAHHGYRFPRRARYLGAWIGHGGWYPDAKVRLYDRRRAAWHGDFVHESVRVDGPVGDLDGDLLHYTCDRFSDHVARVNRYTDLAAQELRRDGRSAAWLRLTLAPLWTFVRTYLLQQGFRDGYRGLLIAQMAAFYVFLKYAKLRFAPDDR